MKKFTPGLEHCAKIVPSAEGRAPHKISRRSFLGSTALVMLPTLCGGCGEDDGLDALPAVVNKAIVIPLKDFPPLTKVGGSLVGRADGYASPIVIARVGDSTFAALDAICTHMECTVAYNALNMTLDCPCHGSTYEVDGTVISGPAPRALNTLTAQSDGTTLTITVP